MASKEDSANDSNVPGVPNAKDDIYEDRPMAKKVIRIVTVVAYLVSVSFVAIALSVYYIFLWRPPPGGSLSLRDPHAEYLMESPPNRSINEIIDKINLFRKNRFNTTRSPTTSPSLHAGSKDLGNLVKMMALLRRNYSWENPDTSTGVYDSISSHKPENSLNMSRIDVLTTPGNLNVRETSTVEGEEYINDERNITDLNLASTSGGIGEDVDGVGNGTYRQEPDDEMFTDITRLSGTTSPKAMQIPRKMSAQNVMASISRTLGTRHESNVKASNEVKFAGEESKDKLYLPKHRQKAFRVMTVVAYVISVSLAAILLSLYYTFLWDPKDHTRFTVRPSSKHNLTTKVECINPTLPTGLEPPEVIGIKEKTTVKSNATDASQKHKQIYSPVYMDEDQPRELESSLDPLPTINPTSSEYQEDISEENIEEPLDIEFDGDNLPRR